MLEATAGFLEIEHTADWELQVWAPDVSTLFEQAALGMYSLAETRLMAEPQFYRTIDLHNLDNESLLVGFLSELLYITEADGLGFDSIDVSIEESTLHAEMQGRPLEALSKEIKAVTYHNLEIKEVPGGFEVNIVFDV